MTTTDMEGQGKEKLLTCGLVMPISSIDGCGAEHWVEVKNIICEAVESIQTPRFSIKLVSDADDIGVIQKRIVQNIYSSDILVCDVSGKNPNVMFELGMRLAFDKPTVIIKDDKTDYSFDTGIIEHVPYPRDLRFSRVVSFKTALADKVAATYRAATSNAEHSTFLKNFGKFQVAQLSETSVPAEKLTLEMLSELQQEVSSLRQSMPRDLLRRSKRPETIEAVTRILTAIDAYRKEKPKTKLRDLLGNEDFYLVLEDKAQAPRHFAGPREFRESVEQVLKELVSISDET